MDAPEAVKPHSPLASADDPPPSPGPHSSRMDLGLGPMKSGDMSMSWTEVSDEWAEQRPQSRGGSGTSASLPAAVASDMAAHSGIAETSAGAQVYPESDATRSQSGYAAGRSSEPADVQTGSDFGSYEGTSPAAWSRRSSFGSSIESQSAVEVPERPGSSDTEDSDSIEHMRLSFPDPISSSSSALASHGFATPANDSESDTEVAGTETIEKDEAPPIGLGGEYSLLLDTVGPPSDSTGASATSMSDTSSQASHSSSVPPSPSSNASRQLAAIHSDLESPVKLASGAVSQPDFTSDTGQPHSTSPLLSLGSLPSTPPPFQTAESRSSPTEEHGSPSKQVHTSETPPPARLLETEQQDGWRNLAAYDEEQVQAWLQTAGLYRARPPRAQSDGHRVGATGAAKVARSGYMPREVSTNEPNLVTAQAMSVSLANAPRSMASSTATVVPTPVAGRAKDGYEDSRIIPGAMPTEKRDPLRTDVELTRHDKLQDVGAGRASAQPNPTRSRRTVALLSVAYAALAIALAGWAYPPLPAPVSPPHETAATALPIAQVPISPPCMSFSKTLEALLIQTVPSIGSEASQRTTAPAEQTLSTAASDALESVQGGLCDHVAALLDPSPEGFAASIGAESTEGSSPPFGGWKAAKAFPVETSNESSLAEHVADGRASMTSKKSCRCRELRRQRRRREHLSLFRSSPNTPPLIAARSHNLRDEREESRRKSVPSGHWSEWVGDGTRLRTAADAVGASVSALVAATVERGGDLVTSAARGRRKLSQRVDKELDVARARMFSVGRHAEEVHRRIQELCQRSPALPECKPYRLFVAPADQLRGATRRARRSLSRWPWGQAVAREERRIVKRARDTISDVYVGLRPFVIRHTKRLARHARRAQPLAHRGGQVTARYARSLLGAFRRQEKLLQKRFAKGEKRDGKRQRRRDKRAAKYA